MRWVKCGAFALICVAAMGFLFWNRSQEAHQTRVVLEENDKKPSITILVLGCDASEQRPDCIMLAHVDGKTNKVNFLSLPRDSKIRENGRTRKLNTVLSLTDGAGAMKRVEQLTGVEIDYYFKINPGVFARIVDALGGVEYTVEQDMKYSDPSQNLYIDLKAGNQILTGAQCEQYCRYRNYLLGDLTRTLQQQKLITALLEQKMKLQYVVKLPAIYHIIKEETQTNLKAADVSAYLPLLRQMTEQEVRFQSLDCPGEYNDMKKEGVSYFLLDEERLRELCAAHFSTI